MCWVASVDLLILLQFGLILSVHVVWRNKDLFNCKSWKLPSIIFIFNFSRNPTIILSFLKKSQWNILSWAVLRDRIINKLEIHNHLLNKYKHLEDYWKVIKFCYFLLPKNHFNETNFLTIYQITQVHLAKFQFDLPWFE